MGNNTIIVSYKVGKGTLRKEEAKNKMKLINEQKVAPIDIRKGNTLTL